MTGVASIGVMMATRFISNGLIAGIVLILAAGSFLLFVCATYRRRDEPPTLRGGATR